MLLWAITLVVLNAQESGSEMVECYRDFDAESGRCGYLLGAVEKDDCCQNPHYGYVDVDGACGSCRPASWSEWTAWGPCTVSCLEGVTQRRRFCYGIGVCNDTHQLGNLQTKACKDQECCPVQGGWGEWGPWQECSVTCGTGQRIRERICSEPAPECGGRCDGASKNVSACDTGKPCAVHGGWSPWGSWGPCSSNCVIEGSAPPVRRRSRSCSNPPPSTDPPGNTCPGPDSEPGSCTFLPFCPVPGAWGQWSSFSACSVTCGVGEQVRTRQCDSPPPRHGGEYCPGRPISTQLCNTKIHCPVDGEWSEWGEWETCARVGRKINCKPYAGTHRRERTCEHRDWGGKACSGPIAETRPCYDIERCRMKGNWSEWSKWGLCEPNCGDGAVQTRTRECMLDFSEYKMEVGPRNEKAYMSGKPWRQCVKGPETTQKKPCLNVPPCQEP